MKKNNVDENTGTFVGHLTELRSRLVKSFAFLFFLFIGCYFFSTEIYRFLVQPYSDVVLLENLDRRLIFTALHEAFLTYLKVAFFAAFFISSPFFLIQLWKFIAPGLYKNEKKSLTSVFNRYTFTLFIRWLYRLLLNNASSDKIFPGL